MNNNIAEEFVRNLSPEVREKAKKCRTPEEFLALMDECDIELSSEQLDAVSGGRGFAATALAAVMMFSGGSAIAASAAETGTKASVVYDIDSEKEERQHIEYEKNPTFDYDKLLGNLYKKIGSKTERLTELRDIRNEVKLAYPRESPITPADPNNPTAEEIELRKAQLNRQRKVDDLLRELDRLEKDILAEPDEKEADPEPEPEEKGIIYTIFFDTKGGSYVIPIRQEAGTAVETPEDPVREGYRFIGWDKAIPAVMPGVDIVINAKWEKIEAPAPVRVSTISFDTKGGSYIPPIKQEAGTAVEAPEDPVREGYRFLGWDKGLPAVMPDIDIALNARWEKIEQSGGSQDAGDSGKSGKGGEEDKKGGGEKEEKEDKGGSSEDPFTKFIFDALGKAAEKGIDKGIDYLFDNILGGDSDKGWMGLIKDIPWDKAIDGVCKITDTFFGGDGSGNNGKYSNEEIAAAFTKAYQKAYGGSDTAGSSTKIETQVVGNKYITTTTTKNADGTTTITTVILDLATGSKTTVVTRLDAEGKPISDEKDAQPEEFITPKTVIDNKTYTYSGGRTVIKTKTKIDESGTVFITKEVEKNEATGALTKSVSDIIEVRNENGTITTTIRTKSHVKTPKLVYDQVIGWNEEDLEYSNSYTETAEKYKARKAEEEQKEAEYGTLSKHEHYELDKDGNRM